MKGVAREGEKKNRMKEEEKRGRERERERRGRERGEGSSPLGQERHVSDASWHNCESSTDRLTRACPGISTVPGLTNEKIIK